VTEEVLRRLSDSDILFLLETVEPRLIARIETIKGDPSMIEGILEQESESLFRRVMLLGEAEVLTKISPRLFFEVLLRRTLSELQSQSYTVERTASQKIPVFDTKEVLEFLNQKIVLGYLADMLSSFTRIESFTLPVRVRKGIWRKIRFNDMDIDSLVRFCETVDEEYRFGFYKRIADVCLFILGMFPEYVRQDFRYPLSGKIRPRFGGRWRRSVEDYEEEGRRFYKLAGGHRDARVLKLSEVLWQLHERFGLAKKPLNFISDNFLHFKKQKLFPSVSSN